MMRIQLERAAATITLGSKHNETRRLMPLKLHLRLLGTLRTNYPLQQSVTACGRALDWIRRNNFLLLSAPRCGTTLTVNYLNCSRQIRCRGEILGQGHFQYGHPFRMQPDRLKLHFESFFVKRPGVMTGAKILTYHLDELPIKLVDLIEILDRPKIVVLYRENTLEQYVSLKLAEGTGVWHAKRTTSFVPIRLDPDDYLAFAERERRMWRDNFDVLDRSEIHTLAYERLCARPDASMRGVFEYLGVRPVAVRSRLVKIDPRPLWSKLANYQQFVRRGILARPPSPLPYVAAHDRRAAA